MKSLLALISLSMISNLFAQQAKLVEYRVDDTVYEGSYTHTSDNAPLVIMIHDWDGLTEYEHKRAQMLSELGYSVFAADMFGKGIRPTETAEKRKQTGALYKNRAKMRELVEAAIMTAKSQGGNTDNAVAMGYCFGGTVVLELARTGVALKGFVPFHGGLEIPKGQDYSKARGTIVVFHGTADKHVTMEHFAGLAKAMEKYNVKHEMITYSGAPHAFSVFGSSRYRKDADQKSWARFIDFLDEILKGN